MNHKKHISSWFTTSTYRAINLTLVTDVRLIRRDSIVVGAAVYIVGSDRTGEGAILIDANDAAKLLDLLV